MRHLKMFYFIFHAATLCPDVQPVRLHNSNGSIKLDSLQTKKEKKKAFQGEEAADEEVGCRNPSQSN